MSKYEQLVKALRCCGKDLMPGERCKDSCPYGGIALCLPKLKLDAAAAIEELQAELPKRGEWIPIQIGKWRGHKCSCCGIAREVPCSSSDGIPQWKYCPECGARMEVQE